MVVTQNWNVDRRKNKIVYWFITGPIITAGQVELLKSRQAGSRKNVASCWMGWLLSIWAWLFLCTESTYMYIYCSSSYMLYVCFIPLFSFFLYSIFVFSSLLKKNKERGEGWKCFPCVRACPADHATDTLESVSRRIPLASLMGHFHFLWVLSS